MAAAPTLPERMRAVQVTEYNAPYETRTVPVPAPGPRDLIVKVAVASYCHTDAMVRSGAFAGDPRQRLPLTASHEGAGTVAAVGADVATFAPGDRVMCGLPLHPCGSCPDCRWPDDGNREGRRQYCTRVKGHVGVHIDGCLAEYVRIDERTTTKLPDAVSFLEAAPLACAGRTVYRGVLQSGLDRPGQWLAIVGAGGGLGHLGVQFARAWGLRVVGVDARDEGLELARRHGADIVADARRPKDLVVAEVRRAIASYSSTSASVAEDDENSSDDHGGADATLVLSEAPGAAALGCALTRMHGRLVQIAQPELVSVPFQELVFRDIRLRGSVLCSPCESEDMVRLVAELRARKRTGFEVSTVPFRGLDSVAELVRFVESGRLSGKAVVIVDEDQVGVSKV